MRLLHAKDFVFKEFIGKSIPRYAILSHRWTDEEVSYQEFLDRRKILLRGKCAGYGWSKITKLCEIARKRGVDWVWIDTACIDKKSSAELSEAINSMYAWYQRAAVCYVFLPDVADIQGCTCDPLFLGQSVLGQTCGMTRCAFRDKRVENAHFAVFHQEDFHASVWFTRSWTLQELLAPSALLFFNSMYSFIGTKVDLADLIHKHTGIDAFYLCTGGQNMFRASVAKRLSWASKREATREEDIAYSLLGLFQINMPLLYREGQRAFKRLQMEIIKTSTDESIFAWECGSTTISSPGLLARHITDFARCGNILQYTGVQRAHYEITNKGLLITLPLMRPMVKGILNKTEDVYWLLNCVKDGTFNRIAVPVAISKDHSFSSSSSTPKSLTGYRMGNKLAFAAAQKDPGYESKLDDLRLSFKCMGHNSVLIGVETDETVDIATYFEV